MAINEQNNKEKIKFNWTAASVLLTGMLFFIGWIISVETRLGAYQTTLNVSDRVQNLETLFVPLLIEYKVQEKVKELGIVAPNLPLYAPPSILPSPMLDDESSDDVREEAEKWANEQVRK